MFIEKVYACLRGFGLENRVQKFNAELAAQALNVARRAKTRTDVCKLPEALS